MNHKNIFLISGILFAVSIVFFTLPVEAATVPVTGYAWSDTIGWIQFNPSFGGVFLDDTTGNFFGYAWSENIGWINFGPTSGFPEAPLHGAKKETDGTITGWAKAVAGGTAEAGGWDGWIKMSETVFPASQWQCPLDGQTYSDQTTCNTNCTQTANCILNNVTAGGSIVSNEFTKVVGNNTTLDFYSGTAGKTFEGSITLSGATASGSVVGSNFFTKVVGNNTTLDFYSGSMGKTFEGSITLSGATASGNLSSGGVRFTKVVGNNTTLDFYTGSTGVTFRGSITLSGSVYTCPLGSYSCSGTPSSCTKTQSCTEITTPSFNYGVNIDSEGNFSGYAWGSDVVGWLSFSGTASDGSPYRVTLSPPPTLDVALSSNPSSGNAPLTSTLTATVSGTAVGTINYKFDCNDDGTYEGTFDNSSDNPKTYNCTYSAPGDYTARVYVERDIAASAEATVSITVNPPPTLDVALSSNPSSGTVPLNDVDLTAVVSGTEIGTINYTFYCNRSDSGTNITAGYAAEYGGETATTKTAQDICDYSSAGTYTAKVIVERGALAAEDRTIINVQPLPQCNDGIDNNFNGCTDYPADTGCTSATDTTESGGICIAQPDFSLTADPSIITVTLVEGGSAQTVTSVIKVLPLNGFNENVSLSVKSISPALTGASYAFSDSVLAPSEYSTGSVFSITVPATASPALYTITIQGDGTTISGRTTEIKLNVESYESPWPCEPPACPPD